MSNRLRVVPKDPETTDGGLRVALWRSGSSFEVCPSGTLLQLRSQGGRTVYVEERRAGSTDSRTWVVHVDGSGCEPARQHVCATLGLALQRIRAELADRPLGAVG